MGLKIQQSTGLVRELKVCDTFFVSVKHLTRIDIEKLVEACSGKDEDEQAAISSRAYISGWRGLTIAIARKIGVMVEDDQPVDKNGQIPYDPDTARDLWRNAYSNRFMAPIMSCSRSILEAIEAEKEIAKNGFGGWSEVSTTL